jgi:hypothetical protein
MQRMANWVLRVLMAVFLLVFFFAVSTAHAGGVVGTETIAEYRGWVEAQQSGYVLAAMGVFSSVGGVRCEYPPTVGVMKAWLASDQVKLTDNVIDSIFFLSMTKHGCRTEPKIEKPKVEKPGVST